jgi:hypothetical protein
MYLGKRHIIVVLVIGLVLAVAFVWWRSISLSQHSAAIADGVSQYRATSKDSPLLTSATSPVKPAPTTNSDSTIVPSATDLSVKWEYTDAQMQEVRAWARSRGSVTIRSDGEYYSYNLETLRTLAENSHDVKAMTVLAQMSGAAERLKWYRLAAVYGSSDALVGAAIASFENDPATPDDVKRAQLLDALAYKKVAELRNDFLATRGFDIETLQNQAGIRLTDEDKTMAEQMAQPLYDELEAQRVQLGLGKFDNSAPPVVEAYYRAYVFK